MQISKLIYLVMISLLLTTASCREAGKSARPRVALLMKAQSNPFFQVMEQGARRAAEESKVEPIVLYLPSETAADTQVGQVEDVIAKQVNAILIAPSGSSAIIPALLKANEARIPIINLD